MKRILLPLAAASAFLFVAGCNNNASTESQSTNAPAEQQSPAVDTNSASGAEVTNAAPSAGADMNSAGVETNNPVTTNSMTPP
jgi:hypothetical protein